MKIHFIKKAAFVFDLSFLFFLYFNKDLCFSKEERFFQPTEENRKHVETLLSMISPIPPELYLFFYKSNSSKVFFTEQLFHSQHSCFADETYDLSTILKTITTQKDELNNNLFRYYFEGQNLPNWNEAQERLRYINQLIRKSDYNSTLKNSLYAFFIDPESIWNTLKKQLLEKANLLTEYYKENTLLLQKLSHGFETETTLKGLKYLGNLNIDTVEQIYVSFTLCNSYLFLYYMNNNKLLLFLGAYYQEMIADIIKQSENPDLLLLGNVLSDNTRLQMIRFIARKKEVSVKDIQDEFGFTAANSYYHLNKMQNSGMLLTRNQGRKVLYRINQIYFNRLSNIFGEYGCLEIKHPS